MTKTTTPGTRAIGIKPATNVFHAVRFAREIGRDPNLFVTVNLSKLGIGDEAAGPFFSALRAKVRRAWKYRRDHKNVALGALDDVGAHENPDGKRHVHWLVRVPEDARSWFEEAVDKFARKLAGLDDLGTAIETQEIYALGGLTKYIMKGVDAQFGSYFHTDTSDQGEVICRRTFASRTLGYAARKEANWKRKRRPRVAVSNGRVASASQHRISL